ncbi:TraV family lipoprotein [Cellvibrio sp.]|uniref:TraV family lipoprotein n=1 Tax=Cellvibrio sp. TaxID=1965322 RepID=UPI0039648454
MKIIPITLLLALLMSCSSNYSCGMFPHTGCKPVSRVYAENSKGLNDYRGSLTESNNKSDHGLDSKASAESKEININIAPVNSILEPVRSGTPLLSKPLIMRVYLTPWEDNDRDLNMGSFVYVRVRDAEWQLPQ